MKNRAATYNLKAYEFDLPTHLIAQYPKEIRSQSKLLVFGKNQKIKDTLFENLTEVLSPNDILVVNNTKVIKARMKFQKPTGGKVEIFLLKPQGEFQSAKVWKVMGKPMKNITPGMILSNEFTSIEIIKREGKYAYVKAQEPLLEVAQKCGEIPLPPYIQREQLKEDAENYQTIFANELGAVAAPTASRHFDTQLLNKLQGNNVQIKNLTLHVGEGTFLPVSSDNEEDYREHPMHSEWYSIPDDLKDLIENKNENQRIIAVGTTVCRALETYANTGQQTGNTDIFIYPGYQWQCVDALITNFHLPKSTLLLLVASFIGKENLDKIYQHGINESYRFYSYGDAMYLEKH